MANRVEAFREWLASGQVGSVFTYYRGFLATDRATIFQFGNSPEGMIVVPNEEIDTLGKLAIDAWETGRAHLFQRRLRPGDYEYIAMKRYMAGPLWETRLENVH